MTVIVTDVRAGDAPRAAALRSSRWQALTAHIAFSVRTAIEAVSHNKLRAGLTSLGILFGVASVIAMLASDDGRWITATSVRIDGGAHG